MKLYLTLSGTFHRTPINQPTEEPVTMAALMQSYQAVATQVKARSPQLLHQQFGLQFLSTPILVKLLQQANQTEVAEELYQISSLQLLKPLKPPIAQPIFYQYQFIYLESQIELSSDDLQIPTFWNLGETAQTGIYEVILENTRYRGLSRAWLDSLVQEVQTEWQNYSPLEKIQMAIQSSETTNFYFNLVERAEVKVSVNHNELPIAIRESISHLRKPQSDGSQLSPGAKTLIQRYQQEYSLSSNHFQLPQDLNLDLSIAPHHQFIIGKGKSRKAIERLVNQAEQFLFVSSYIIEDRSLTELICQKAATLPQGVWILTDLRDEVVNRIDTQVEHESNSSNYQRSDEHKVQCLTMLLEAGSQIRGGSFHLKTYISEQAAYLGSCNLTGGSLDFNLEGGLICQGTTSYQDLVEYFTHFWQYRTGYDVFPSPTEGSFIQRGLNNSSSAPQFRSETLLTPSQYRNDLEQELSRFRGQVEIYSRGFAADARILPLLQTHSTHVYFEAFINTRDRRIFQHFLPGVHAKITLLGDRIAYLGGVNFNFTPQGFNSIDLMYKTSNRQEIHQIRKQLSALSF